MRRRAISEFPDEDKAQNLMRFVMKRESWAKPMVTIWAWIWWRNDISVQALKEERSDILLFQPFLGRQWRENIGNVSYCCHGGNFINGFLNGGQN